MWSGLVPITNRVAAVPEFLSSAEGYLCEPEDSSALADSIEQIVVHADKFKDLSKAASERIQTQCGYDATVAREIKLLKR